MRKYIKFASMAFQRTIAYRVEYYTGVLNAFLYIFIFTSVWKALISENESVAGLTQKNMVVYSVIATLIKASFGRSESLISTRVKTGEIATDLMKPYSVPGMYFADMVGVSFFQVIARSIPILIFCLFVFDINLSLSFETIIKFFPVYILSFILFFALSFLISSMAFYFVDIFPFWIFYFALVTFTSGAIIPLDFFPEQFAEIIKFSPFPYLFYYPTMLILGKLNDIVYLNFIFRYIAIISVVMTFATVSFSYGLRKLTIAGG